MNIDIRTILTRLGIDYKDKGEQLIAQCPNPAHNDNNPSWNINTNPPFKHHCFSCGYSGNLITLLKTMGATSLLDKNELNTTLYSMEFYKSPDASPISKKSLETKIETQGNFIHPFDDTQAKDYCKQRHIYKDFITTYDVTYSNHTKINGTVFSRRLCIPIIENRKLISMEGRTVIGGKPKNLYPKNSRTNTLFNIDNLDRDNELYVVEGIMDLPHLFNLGLRNSTAVFGSLLTPRQQTLLSEFKKLVLIPDNDKAGNIFIETIESFYPNEYDIIILPSHRKDVGECTTLEIRKFISNRITGAKYFLKKYGFEHAPKIDDWW